MAERLSHRLPRKSARHGLQDKSAEFSDCPYCDESLTLWRKVRRGHMPNDMRIAPEVDSRDGHSVTFVLAIGTVRQMCRLQTTFRTQSQAFSYLQKYRTEFERIARERFARGQIEDGLIKLTML